MICAVYTAVKDSNQADTYKKKIKLELSGFAQPESCRSNQGPQWTSYLWEFPENKANDVIPVRGQTNS